MKKVKSLLICGVLLLASFAVAAQSGLGFRVGANIAKQDYDNDAIDSKTRTGLDLAVVYEAEFAPALALQPEFHYAQAGTNSDTQFGNFEYSVNYLQVPILLKIDLLSTNPGLDLSPFIGPYAAYAFSGKVNDEDIDFGDEYERLDYGVQMGVMLKAAGGLFVDVRYSIGVEDVTDNNIDLQSSQNRILGIGAGLFF